MFKKISLVLIVLVLAACTSEPIDKRFRGTGDFDSVEAAKTRVSLGLTYLKNGNFSQAKFNLDKALEFAPRSGEANYAMAFYYQQVEEIERAQEYYESAISYSQNDPDVLNSYGAFLCKQGQFEKAETYFLKAVDDKSYISAAETYENLAICLQSQGEIDEAISYFNSALKHQPTRTSTLFYLAQLYTERGQWEDAKRALWKYERNASVSAESIWLSFQIAQGQNDLRASLEYVELLKRLYPDNANIKKALAQLGKFQPDMTITQKNKSYSSADDDSVPHNAEGIGDNRDASNKKAKVLTPVLQQTNSTESINQDSMIGLGQGASGNDAMQTAKPTIQRATTTETIRNSQAVSVIAKKPEVNDNPDFEESDQSSSFHIVKANDNLFQISVQYNVRVIKLLEWNNLEDASSIHTGSKLWVRNPNPNE